MIQRTEPTRKEDLDRITGTVIGAAKISGLQVGLLINFNVHILRDGARRIVNSYPDSLRSLRPLR